MATTERLASPEVVHSDRRERSLEKVTLVGVVLVGVLVIFNQIQLAGLSASFGSLTGAATGGSFWFGEKGADLSDIDVDQITSTAMAVATLFPELKEVKGDQDAIGIMIPEGRPGYSEALGGITFDDPVNSMKYLAQWYFTLKEEVKKNDPELWQRYLKLAAAPHGISCEFCCGVGAEGIDARGDLRCGCQHNPALQALTLGLMQNTDNSDAEILKEVMRWKALWFPKNMVEMAMQVAGADPSQLKSLPGMVGGC